MFGFQKILPPSRLLQAHEYLELMRDGAEKVAVQAPTLQRALDDAQAVWPSLGLGPWSPTAAATQTYQSRATGQILIYVPAGPADVFVIFALANEKSTPHGHILFDLGAQYAQPTFLCPAFAYEGPANAEIIQQCLQQLDGQRDPFAVVELRGDTYMQVYVENNRYELEHQLMNTSSHYRASKLISCTEAINALLSYSSGDNAWAHAHQWEKIDL